MRRFRSIWRTPGVRQLVVLAVVASMIMPPSYSNASDFMDVNYETINNQRVITAIQGAEAFWEERIQGYRDDLPKGLLRQMHKMRINSFLIPIDGVGGAAANASTDATAVWGSTPPPGLPPRFGGSFGGSSRRWEIAQEGSLRVDIDDIGGLNDSQLFFVLAHEMGHAIGFNPNIWAGNNLLTPDGLNYTGEYGLREYQRVRGDLTRTFVPLEDAGGGGTAGAHWELNDPAFLRPDGSAEIMTGFVSQESFLSSITIAQWTDVGYATSFRPNTRDVVLGGGFPTKWTVNPPPVSFISFGNAVPEPSSLTVLFGLGVLLTGRRRRKK